jgi:hypothetical protein
LANHRIEGAGVEIVMTGAGDIDEFDLTADYAAIAAMASGALANLFKVIGFNDRDKFANGAF